MTVLPREKNIIKTALPINGKNAEPYGMDLPIKKQKQDNESKVQ